jgi:hypothetical protein
MFRQLLLLALLASACHGPDPAQQAQEDIRSWSASLALAATSWAGNKLPAAYVRKLAEQGDEALGQLPQGTPKPLLQAASRARTLARAVARNDASRAAALGRSLQAVADSQKDGDS